jgi:hypothetical protein
VCGFLDVSLVSSTYISVGKTYTFSAYIDLLPGLWHQMSHTRKGLSKSPDVVWTISDLVTVTLLLQNPQGTGVHTG